MKAWAVGIFVVCVSSNCFAATSIAYEELQDIIRKNNKAVQAGVESVNAAKLRVGTIERSFLPKAAFEAGIAEQKEANGTGDTAPFWKVDVQANLYRAGRDKVSLLLKDSQVLIRELDAQALYRSEIFKAKTDYMQLATVRKLQDLTRASMDDYDGLKKSILRKAQAGLMTKTAIQKSQLEIDELKRQLIILESEGHEIQDRLGLELGLAPDEEITLTTKFGEPKGDAHSHADEAGLDELPEIKRLALQSESAKLEAQTRNEWWIPEVNVFASYTGFNVERRDEFGSLPQREMNIGVRLSIDLESKSTWESELSAKRSDSSSIQMQREHLKREIGHKLHEYRREMETQSKLMRTYESAVSRSENILKQLRGEFERGIVGTDEISATIHSIYELKRKRLESTGSYLLARAGLETLMDLGEHE